MRNYKCPYCESSNIINECINNDTILNVLFNPHVIYNAVAYIKVNNTIQFTCSTCKRLNERLI